VTTRHQVLTALAARYGGPGLAPIRPLGVGVNFAAGDRRRLVLSGWDGTPPGLPETVMREIETGGRALMEYMMARGPEPGDLPALRAYRYRPEAVVQVEQDRLQREERLAAMLRDGTASRGRLGDLVHARYLFRELDSHLRAGLEQYGIDLDDFFANGKEWLSAFLDDIPSATITITLTEKGFRNADKRGRATTCATPTPCPRRSVLRRPADRQVRRRPARPLSRRDQAGHPGPVAPARSQRTASRPHRVPAVGSVMTPSPGPITSVTKGIPRAMPRRRNLLRLAVRALSRRG
jgi:hypothetical protein